MKNCAYCKIDVGGNLKKCPLCQSTLNGEGERPYFPAQTVLKIQSFFYRMQLFIVWAAIIASLGMDFLMEIDFGLDIKHWSILVTLWLFGFEYVVDRLFIRSSSPSRVISCFILIVLALSMLTAYYLEPSYLYFLINWVIPVVIMGGLLTNFILAMLDKKGNAMAYLLGNVLIGIVPYLVFFLMHKEPSVEWIICLIFTLILLVGSIIFKGREVSSELQRRFNV